MREKKTLLTYEGVKKLEDELQDLKVVQRKEIASPSRSKALRGSVCWR